MPALEDGALFSYVIFKEYEEDEKVVTGLSLQKDSIQETLPSGLQMGGEVWQEGRFSQTRVVGWWLAVERNACTTFPWSCT